VLALRALGLGDLLTGVPALRALRRAVPDVELVLAAPEALGPLVRLAGVADRLTDTAGPVTPPWDGSPPDLAVDLHGRGPQSHRALLSLAPRRLVAFDCPEIGHHGPAWRAGEHERARWCRLLVEELGVAADPGDVLIGRPERPSPAPGAVVIHPGASAPSRRWPADRLAAVARRLRCEGYRVVVTGNAGEHRLAEEVARRSGLGDEDVLAGSTDLLSLAALVAGARLVVCGDTGTAHLASAYGVPSVVLFGPVPPSEWGPPPGGPHTVLWKGSGRGDPHGASLDPALGAISVAEVLSAARTRLRSGRGAEAGQGRSSETVSPRATGVTTSAKPATRAASTKSDSGEAKTP
jgi:ADP-heptose:LPS heptosyltransferase